MIGPSGQCLQDSAGRMNALQIASVVLVFQAKIVGLAYLGSWNRLNNVPSKFLSTQNLRMCDLIRNKGLCDVIRVRVEMRP